MNDFFDLPKDNFVPNGSTGGGKKEDPNIYNPDPNAHNGSYKSVFRFVPYLADKKLSKYTKYSAKFYNPLTKESLFIDCPSNEGKPSILWDLQTVIRGLEKEEPELHKELSERFSRWFTTYSPVYIKKDPQRPDLNGFVKIFKYAKQINDLIEAQIAPPADELVDNVKSVNPFHLLEGKDFLCVVGKKTKTFRDWSKCKFMDDVTPFIFEIKGTKVTVENNEKSVKLVSEFLKKNTPSMEEYLHVSWTDSTFEQVAQAIVSCINNKAVINLLLEKTKDDKMKALIQEKLEAKGTSAKKNKPKTEQIDENVEFEDENSAPLNDIDELEESESTDNNSSESENSDEYDELFKDL